MEFQNLNIQQIAAEMGMKDMIIMELQGRIKILEDALAQAQTQPDASNGQVDDKSKALITP